jgi:hypothetical protein
MMERPKRIIYIRYSSTEHREASARRESQEEALRRLLAELRCRPPRRGRRR